MSGKKMRRGDTTPKTLSTGEVVSAVSGVSEFPTHTFPATVAAYITAASEAIGCCPSFIALPLLVAIAGAIGNSAVMRVKQGWIERAIVWTAIVAKSGGHKTPALQAAMKFLQAAQEKAIAAHAIAQEQYDTARSCFERDYAAWKHIKNNSAAPPVAPTEPVCQRYITADTTTEALASLLSKQFNGLVVVRDELSGFLGGFDAYKSTKGSDVAHYLAMWSGTPLTIDRRTGDKRLTYIPRASVSVTGGIQPATLRSAIGREHMQDGLCARVLFSMPKARPIRWTEAVVPWEVEIDMQQLFDNLLSLEPGLDGDGNLQPVVYDFTPEAKQVWIAYYNRHRQEVSELDDDLAAAFTKIEAYVPRFALIFSLCERASGNTSDEGVDETSMQAAIELAEWFGAEARRVYGMFSESDDERDRRELCELIARKGGIVTARDLMRSGNRFKHAYEAEAALVDLATKGKGKWEFVPAGPKGGSPTNRFILSSVSTADTTPGNTGQDAGCVNGNGAQRMPTAEEMANYNPYGRPQ
jgi:hypothetical protein